MVDPDVEAALLAEYSQSIDTSTVLAILSDFDLSDPAQVVTARQTLDILKESAQEEELSGFDASATFAGLSGGRNRSGDQEGSVSTRSAAEWTTTEGTESTDGTGLSADVLSDLEGLTFETRSTEEGVESSRHDSIGASSGLDELSNEGKEQALMGIFPRLKHFDVQWTLKKCKYDASHAVEELMTQSFLVESGERQRGVDAFVENSETKSKRKTKKKGRGKENEVMYNSSMDEKEVKTQSHWEKGQHDVEFLCQNTGIPKQQVTSLYHQHGASAKATIRAIVDKHLEIGLLDEDDAVMQLQVHDLQAEYPTLSDPELSALVQITQPSLIRARALADALTSQEMTNKKGGIKIEFRHAPPDFSSDENSARPVPRPLPSNLDHIGASTTAQSLHVARTQASLQAAAAFRKSRSSPLYGGAASYYSQVSRDLADKARNMDSVAADALVSSQSTRTQLDLHGVNVKDAVRISRERVTEWWVRESEERARAGRRGETSSGGYRIITGAGRHSEGGRSKLGPAVGAMLVREGWKIEVGSGAIVVRGVARR